jgi:DNA-binding MarR family transcriptional regulator
VSTTTPTFNAQLLGQTEKAANAILDRLLAEPGITEPQWVTLSLAIMSGGTPALDDLRASVAGALKVADDDALALIRALGDKGLVSVPSDGDSPVAVTAGGQRVFAQVRAATAEITERLWGDLPETDLAAAGRVLSTVLERANAVLAR